jgi:hypothetical protein
MSKKFICYLCSTHGIKDEMIREQVSPNTSRYYHKDCKNINTLNKSIHSGLHRKESKKHQGSKRVIFELLTNGDRVLIDQHLQQVNLDFDFIAVESPVTHIHKNKIPFLDIHDCTSCIEQYKKDNEFNLETVEEFHNQINVNAYKSVTTQDYFYQHPCLNCPFNHLRYKYIFDVGIGKEGNYTAAFEILHTSKISKNKIIYCINNDIQLFEIHTIEARKKNKKLKCERVWWKDAEGNIQICVSYKGLFNEEVIS